MNHSQNLNTIVAQHTGGAELRVNTVNQRHELKRVDVIEKEHNSSVVF